MSEPIDALHQAWCAATGQSLHPRASERILYELHKCDVKPEQLALVVKHLQGQNRKFGGGASFRINLQKVCGDTETFLCLLGEAEAVQRNRRPAPTERDKIIQLRERAVDPEKSSTLRDAHPPQSLAEIMRKAAS